MENFKGLQDIEENNFDLNKEFLRFFSFWPYFIVSLIIMYACSVLYLRYAKLYYKSYATIEILDKAQDNDMSLPTDMTIFNRSMINIDNEKGILKSFRLHEKICKELNSNITFYSSGKIKTTNNHSSEWFDDYDLDLKIDSDTVTTVMSYKITTEDDDLIIYDEINNTKDIFKSLSTKNTNHNLPFDLIIRKINNEFESKTLRINNFESTVSSFKDNLQVNQLGKDSDQLSLSIESENPKISDEYLNKLIYEFDYDGVKDRQLEHKRTLDFVDSRSGFLQKELNLVEIKKQNYKKENDLSNIQSDASINIEQKFIYDSELFEAESQLDLINLLATPDAENIFDLMPMNIGVKNEVLNKLIADYNKLIIERENLLFTTGENNIYLKNINLKIESFRNNISITINNYIKTLELKINNIKTKESEFSKFYSSIPENEKTLRSIERELQIKESLFLLLLQKREESAINLAVVKPSIKVIDYAMSSSYPYKPNRLTVKLGFILAGFLIPYIFLALRFYLDNKVHLKSDLTFLGIPIVGEIPALNQNDRENLGQLDTNSRSILSESIRILMANQKYILSDVEEKCKSILITSSVKGEGKTIISTSLSKTLSFSDKKVILIGSDLRNPQIHKHFNIDKREHKGVSDYLYSDKYSIDDITVKSGNLSIIFSGTIPPNPSELLESTKYIELIQKLKKQYDYIIVDSAPCLLVADTFKIAKYFDTSICIVRSNYTNKEILKFIYETYKLKKLNRMSLVLNSVGSSNGYGYKYGYGYGYQYGYNYGYGYGYGKGVKS
ncbi:MAG: hypothetical protein CMC04_07610 [Flavobacteriaceae bacterium]|nr:hypothetical protein [Flavobacteriaceae bacterium]|tara:strand:+ start:32783 stop:35140 length:2358 start_codon:yes stop_codon:yes gene_type:complete